MSEASLDFIDYPESELIIGIVAPTGTDVDYIQKELEDRLRSFGYTPEPIRLSEILERLDHGVIIDKSTRFDHIRTLMDAGDAVRVIHRRGDALALLAVQRIAESRSIGGDDRPEPKPKTAFILRSLKHPDEVIALRRIYREGFFLFGIFASEEERLTFLMEDERIPEEEAKLLIRRDHHSEDDASGLGQETRDTFHLADAFINLSESKENAKKQLWRILDLIFRNPFVTPTVDEHAMYLAYATSFRSGDLSRQVGAVITSEEEEILAVGTNEVPRYGGGLYHADMPNDARDLKRGVDSNAERKDKIIKDILGIVKNDFVPKNPEEVETRGGVDRLIKEGIAKTLLSHITEFGRPVHAEMEALLSCARKGVNPRNGTLYTTTFPCHNCAKHIVNAGIERVVYVEPYPKSLAGELHDDAIDLKGKDKGKVRFQPFVGVGSRRFMDLFSMGLSSGHPVRRKKPGSSSKEDWQVEKAKLRVPMLPTSYLERELATALEVKKMEKEDEPQKENK